MEAPNGELIAAEHNGVVCSNRWTSSSSESFDPGRNRQVHDWAVAHNSHQSVCYCPERVCHARTPPDRRRQIPHYYGASGICHSNHSGNSCPDSDTSTYT